jgi:hypothetical protein
MRGQGEPLSNQQTRVREEQECRCQDQESGFLQQSWPAGKAAGTARKTTKKYSVEAVGERQAGKMTIAGFMGMVTAVKSSNPLSMVKV